MQSHHHYKIGLFRDNVGNFCRAVEKSLRLGSSKGFMCRFQFRHDVFKYLFGDCCILNLEDFDRKYFKNGWDQSYRLYRNRASGIRIVFPIEVDLYIARIGGGRYCLDGTTLRYITRDAKDKFN